MKLFWQKQWQIQNVWAEDRILDPQWERDGTQCLCPCLPTMFSRKVTTVEPEIKHTVVAVSFYYCCYNCYPRAAGLYRGGRTENSGNGRKLKKKKKVADYFKGSEWSTRQGIKPQWAGELKAICWSIIYSSCGFCKLRFSSKDKSFLNVSAGKLRTSQNQEKGEAGINAKWQYARLQARTWSLWIQHPVKVHPD